MNTPRTDREIWWVGFKPDERLEAVWADFARDLEKENAELRKDKERLDWLEANLYTLWASGLRCNESPAVEIAAKSGRFEAESIRDAIDAARKEAQP